MQHTDAPFPPVLIIEFPDRATFLTPEQITMVQQRIQDDRGDAVADELTWTKAKSYLGDLKLWAFGLLFSASPFSLCDARIADSLLVSSTMPAYAFACTSFRSFPRT